MDTFCFVHLHAHTLQTRITSPEHSNIHVTIHQVTWPGIHAVMRCTGSWSSRQVRAPCETFSRYVGNPGFPGNSTSAAATAPAAAGAINHHCNLAHQCFSSRCGAPFRSGEQFLAPVLVLAPSAAAEKSFPKACIALAPCGPPGWSVLLLQRASSPGRMPHPRRFVPTWW